MKFESFLSINKSISIFCTFEMLGVRLFLNRLKSNVYYLQLIRLLNFFSLFLSLISLYETSPFILEKAQTQEPNEENIKTVISHKIGQSGYERRQNTSIAMRKNFEVNHL